MFSQMYPNVPLNRLEGDDRLPQAQRVAAVVADVRADVDEDIDVVKQIPDELCLLRLKGAARHLCVSGELETPGSHLRLRHRLEVVAHVAVKGRDCRERLDERSRQRDQAVRANGLSPPS